MMGGPNPDPTQTDYVAAPARLHGCWYYAQPLYDDEIGVEVRDFVDIFWAEDAQDLPDQLRGFTAVEPVARIDKQTIAELSNLL